MNDTLAAALGRGQDWLRNDPWAARLPLLASVLLVLLIAWQLATITWTLLAPQPASAPAVNAPAAAPAIDPQRIADRHLFGTADAQAAPTAAVDAPETRLDLTLRGIASSGTASARALIAGPDNEEKVYAVGAEVPGGARVHEIRPEYVLLNRRGTLETLRLPKLSGGEGTARAEATATATAVDNLRDQAAADQLVEVVRPQAVMVNGELRGFRLYPGRDRQRFAALGLRAGDLVTAVNGVQLTDPSQGLDAMRALTGGMEVTLTVQRGDEVENIIVTPQ